MEWLQPPCQRDVAKQKRYAIAIATDSVVYAIWRSFLLNPRHGATLGLCYPGRWSESIVLVCGLRDHPTSLLPSPTCVDIWREFESVRGVSLCVSVEAAEKMIGSFLNVLGVLRSQVIRIGRYCTTMYADKEVCVWVERGNSRRHV
jgi:hypothetical protein